MNFAHPLAYNMNDHDFEKMVQDFCEIFFGYGLVVFSMGKDGGKDGRFTGKAADFKGWNGKVIIQAKHSNNPFDACSDNDFFANKTSIINKEILRLKELIKNEGADYYILFTNRKLSGIADTKIRKHLSKGLKMPIENIEIIGLETINRLLENIQFRGLIKSYGLSLINFEFSEEDIKEVILSFHMQIPKIDLKISSKSRALKYDFDKISDQEKNEKNGLSEQFYQIILDDSLQHFTKLDVFLEDPMNQDVKESYFDLVAELRDNIHLKRNDFGNFEEIFEFIYQSVSSDPTLIRKKRFIKILLHYMYHTCSIGEK